MAEEEVTVHEIRQALESLEMCVGRMRVAIEEFDAGRKVNAAKGDPVFDALMRISAICPPEPLPILSGPPACRARPLI